MKGQTIVLTANSTGDYAVQSCLAKWGLKKADVIVKSMGQAEIISAMSSNNADLGGLWAPNIYTMEEKAGAKVICSGKDTGTMIPLDNLVRVVQATTPSVINHYNLFRSVEVDGSPAPGYSSGQAIEGMQQLAQQMIMPGMMYEWTGLTLDELESAGRALVIFGLGILVVYLTLSAQYESFALPFIILLAVPMAVLGALSLVQARGLVDDVYVQL